MNKLSRNRGVSPEINSGNAKQLVVVNRLLDSPSHKLCFGIFISVAVLFVMVGCATPTQKEKDAFRDQIINTRHEPAVLFHGKGLSNE